MVRITREEKEKVVSEFKRDFERIDRRYPNVSYDDREGFVAEGRCLVFSKCMKFGRKSYYIMEKYHKIIEERRDELET